MYRGRAITKDHLPTFKFCDFFCEPKEITFWGRFCDIAPPTLMDDGNPLGLLALFFRYVGSAKTHHSAKLCVDIDGYQKDCKRRIEFSIKGHRLLHAALCSTDSRGNSS